MKKGVRLPYPAPMFKLEVSGKILIIVFLLAFALRLISLDQSLWLDEATTGRVVANNSFTGILTNFSPHDFHPPLYYWTLKLWTTVFGTSEIALRFPSIFFSLLTGWMIYLIGKELRNKRIGLYAMIFFLFNPLVIYYSQEARMYMMVTFLTTCFLYFILRCSDPKNKTRKRDVIFANTFSALSISTFYGSAFFILAFYAYTLYKKASLKQLVPYLPGFILPLLALIPLLQVQLSNSKETLTAISNWTSVLGKADIKNLLLVPVKFTMGRITFEPKAFYYFVAIIWTGFIFYVASRKASKYLLLSTLFVAPLALGFLVSFYKPMLQYFRFLYLLPVLSLLIALGSQNRPQRVRVLAGFFFFSCVYLFFSGFHREDWKGLVKNITDEKKVYMIPSSSDPVQYYNKEIAIKDIRGGYGNESSILVIPYTSDIHGFDYKKALESNGFRQKNAQTVRGLQSERWIR